jgi:hypothetical protein
MKKAKVKFVDDVPAPQRRQYPWRDIADTLRGRPGEWAEVLKDLPSSVVWAVNAGRIKPVAPERGFEAKARETSRPADGPRKTGLLLMRYVPEQDEVAKRNNQKNGVSHD